MAFVWFVRAVEIVAALVGLAYSIGVLLTAEPARGRIEL